MHPLENERVNLSGIQASRMIPCFGMIGNIKLWKGQEILIKAMKHVREAVPNVKCLLVGGTGRFEHPYLEKLQQIMKEEDLQNCRNIYGTQK